MNMSNMSHVMHNMTTNMMNHTQHLINTTVHTMMNHSGGHHGTHAMSGDHGTHAMSEHHGTDHSMAGGGHNGPGGHTSGGHEGTVQRNSSKLGMNWSTLLGNTSTGTTMYFTFSNQAIILFKEWDINTTKGMVWSCFVVFLMALLYEGFKVFREVLREKYGNPPALKVTSNGHGLGTKGPYDTSVYTSRNRFFNWHHILQSFLHMIQVAISYFLMLIAMTFNGWLFASVCVGAGFGYFFFSWKVAKSYDINEHCH